MAAVTQQAAAASAAVSADPAVPTADSTSFSKRSLSARDAACAKQPAGKGPVSSPDTPAAFLASTDLSVCPLAIVLVLLIAKFSERR